MMRTKLCDKREESAEIDLPSSNIHTSDHEKKKSDRWMPGILSVKREIKTWILLKTESRWLNYVMSLVLI